MKNLYIIGAGGLAREVAWLVARINKNKKEWDLKGFVENDTESQMNSLSNTPPGVFGETEWLAQLDKETWVICAVGSPSIRKKIVKKLKKNSNIKFATLVDPSVILSHSVEIGEGCIICAGSIATVNIHIGNNVIINLDCTIGHDTKIGDYVTVYPSANISGLVTIEEAAEIGTGTQIIQGKRIGEATIVGAGAVVISDLPAKCTAVGSPAKIIKTRQ